MSESETLQAAKAGRKVVALESMHVVELLGVDRAEIEPDGSVYVEGPVRGYYLSDAELRLVLRHTAARLGVHVEHKVPARTYVMGQFA